MVKKVVGAVLSVLGAGGCILVVLLIINEIINIIQWQDASGARVLAVVAAFGMICFCLLTKGIKLIRAPKQEAKEMPDFTEMELKRERSTASSMEMQQEHKGQAKYVPVCGAHIWKYKKDNSSGRKFMKYRIFYLLGIMFFAIAVPSAVVFIGVGLSYQIYRILLLVTVPAVTAVVVGAALWIGKSTHGMLISFARDEENNMYLFDYNLSEFQNYAKIHILGSGVIGGAASVGSFFYNTAQDARMIENIDQNHLIEKIMESGEIYPYGQRIVSVDRIKEGRTSSTVYCVLGREDGSTFNRSIKIENSYDNYEELLYSLRRLLKYS